MREVLECELVKRRLREVLERECKLLEHKLRYVLDYELRRHGPE